MKTGRLLLMTLAGLCLSDLPAADAGDTAYHLERPVRPFDSEQPDSRSTAQTAETSAFGEEQYEISIDAFDHARDRALGPTEFMALGADSELWLPRYIDVLKKSRPPYARPETVALIDGEGGARYLVLDWAGPRWDSYHGTFMPLEIHKVVRKEGGGLRLKWLRSFDYLITDLYPPTGRPLFKGEAPVAVIYVWTGGSHPASSGLRLIQMKRNSVDITPDRAGRTVDVSDLDGDGAFEAIAFDERWRGFFDGNLGPYLPVILSRGDGHWSHACRRFAKLFRQRLEGIKEWAQQPLFAQHIHLMVYRAEAYLTHIQLGAFEDARHDLTELLVLAEKQPSLGRTRDDVKAAFEAVLIEAMEKPDDPCQASVTDSMRFPGGAVTSFSRNFGSQLD